VREHAVHVAGAAARDVIPAVTAAQLADEMRFNLDVYWRGRARRPWLFLVDDMVDFAVLTLPRIAYTIETGQVVSKPAAASWLRAREPRWRALIDEVTTRRARGTRTIARLARMRETLRFVAALRGVA